MRPSSAWSSSVALASDAIPVSVQSIHIDADHPDGEAEIATVHISRP
jgi:hypothetical protein